MIQIHHASDEDVLVEVASIKDSAIFDVTTYAAKVGVSANDITEPSSWVNATWEAGGPPYKLTAGFGTSRPLGVLTIGVYTLWARVTGGTEDIKRPVARVRIY